MRRSDRVAKELREGQGLQAAAKRLAETLHDPDTAPAAQAAVARELRLTLQAIGQSSTGEQRSKLDELAARRKARSSG